MRRKKENQEYQADQAWLLPYADLLTLLLALFIVLFAMSEIDAKKYEELAQVFKSEFSGGKGPLDETISTVKLPEKTAEEDPENKDDSNQKNEGHHLGNVELQQLRELQQNINQYIQNNNLIKSIGTKLTDEGLMITIFTDVTFASGSAEVNSKGVEIATKISEFLDTDPPHQIVVSGHADDRPIHNSQFDSNWELSVIRAVNFMKLILENEQLHAERFSSKGYGDKHPIAPNTTEENMAKNRRVEILILPNYAINTEQMRHVEN